MKDSAGKIIYIGKAKNLKNRVTSYFRKGQDHLPKVYKMVSHVADYDFIVTDSEFEALLLECSLIKQHTPKYNILLKDDKGYCYIRVSDEEYPRLTAALQKEDDGARYIGPFISSGALRQAVREANDVFKLPTCSRRFPRDIGKGRPCLNDHINKCMGVCKGNISAEEYRQTVEQAVDYIKNGSKESVKRLTEQMNAAAEELDFELAARLRDRIAAIKKAAAEQDIVIEQHTEDMDIFGVSADSKTAWGSVTMYRGGRLYDKYSAKLGMTDEPSRMREEFIAGFYSQRDEIPAEVLLDEPIENTELLERYLSEKCGHKVKISVPQRGTLRRLAERSKENAAEQLSIGADRSGSEIAALEELAKALGLGKPPRFIECYDISNLGSADMTCGMVVYENGRPRKDLYRKFSIKTVAEQNDYASMSEAVQRRFKRYLDGDENFSTLPDLILLDGGKGHVSVITPLVRSMGIDTPIFGLVKDSKHRTRAAAAGDREISLSAYKKAFALVTAVQDEVHRFAISYTKAKHTKNSFALTVTSVKGIGEKKAKLLMTAFKTRSALRAASREELAQAAGLSKTTADELYKFIHKE